MSSVSPKKARRGESSVPTFSFTLDPPSALGITILPTLKSTFVPPPPLPLENAHTIRQTVGREHQLTGGHKIGRDELGYLRDPDVRDEKAHKSRRQAPLFNIRRRLFPLWIQWRSLITRSTIVVALFFFLFSLRTTFSSVATASPQEETNSSPIVIQPSARTSSRASHVASILAARPGMMDVDMSATVHPVTKLISASRQKWETKLAAQSKTLKQATMEYRRRYHRQPPKGFEHWWRYVKENNVQLVDEYDQIHRDVFLFQALSPHALRNRLKVLLEVPFTFSINVKDGVIEGDIPESMKKIQGAEDRLKGQIEMLRPVAHLLDDVMTVYNLHDYPRGLLGHGHRSELEDRIEDGEYMDETEHFDSSSHGFPLACPPMSLLRRETGRSGSKRSQHGSHHATQFRTAAKSFIADHRETMDVCDHPDLLNSHSAFAGRHGAHGPLEPYFSLAKTTRHGDVLTVPTDFWTPALAPEHEEAAQWKHKTSDKLLWRGRTTGSFYDKKDDWKRHHRFRLASLSSGTEKSYNLLPGRIQKGKTLQAGTKSVTESVLANQLDIGLTDGAKQCSEDDGTCADIQQSYQWHKRMSFDEASKSKYTLDVDGNAWSARFLRLLTSGTLVFKSTVFPEWWTDRAQAWVHYVPVSVSYRDIHDLLEFFKENDLLAEHIASEGRDWASKFWRKEDMTAYMFRVYLEWQRLLAPVRSQADFRYDESMEVVAQEVDAEA